MKGFVDWMSAKSRREIDDGHIESDSFANLVPTNVLSSVCTWVVDWEVYRCFRGATIESLT